VIERFSINGIIVPCFLAAIVLASCSEMESDSDHMFRGDSESELTETAPGVGGGRPKVVLLGDSITAGLGIATSEAYPAQLQVLANRGGYAVEFLPRAESGGTTAGGVRRLGWSLDPGVRAVVIALGGNDGLRGLPIDQMYENLELIITRVKEMGIYVVLVGMEAPPNFGSDYTAQFRQVFHTLAETYEVPFVPFLLEGVAGIAELNQSDGIHPNAEGARRVAEHLWPVIEPLLAELEEVPSVTR